MWYNQHELELACSKVAVYGAAAIRNSAKFMVGFIHLINDISDGWAHWSYGVKCSEDLQGMLIEAAKPCNYFGLRSVTTEQFKKARDKIVRFLLRCKQTKDNDKVRAFINNYTKRKA